MKHELKPLTSTYRDTLTIDIKRRWVYFQADIDYTGNEFRIERKELIKLLKRKK